MVDLVMAFEVAILSKCTDAMITSQHCHMVCQVSFRPVCNLVTPSNLLCDTDPEITIRQFPLPAQVQTVTKLWWC